MTTRFFLWFNRVIMADSGCRFETELMILRFLALCAFALPAVAAATQTPSIAELYSENCAVCHGDHGDGKTRARYGLNPPPRDFTSARAREELTPERMRTSIRYGRPGTGMVAWGNKFSGEQIDGLVEYIRSQFMHPSSAQAQTVTPPQSVHPQGHHQTPPSSAAARDGARLYKRHCAACHGDRGSGAQWTEYSLNPPPRDFTAPAAREELSRERMITSVTYGRPGTAMMSFKKRLTGEQIGLVVDYIRHDFMKIDTAVTKQAKTKVVPPADMSLAFPHNLVGNIERGREFYTHNCFTCHGLEGLGNGPRSGFITPRPRNFVAANSRRNLNRPRLFLAISRGKPGTVMPAWSTVLTDQQIADVAEYVFQTFILGKGTTPPASHKKKALN
jgi:mono/diheme cytochrome c family protein